MKIWFKNAVTRVTLFTTRSLAVAERPRATRVIEYFAKSLKVTRGHSK